MTLEMYCIYRMLYETCGEDRETFENSVIKEIAPNDYHITYKELDPFDGMNFKVKINILPRQMNAHHKVVCQYFIYDSVYGDDSDEAFEIEL